MSSDEEVSRSELFELLQYFSKYPFRARDANSKVTSSVLLVHDQGIDSLQRVSYFL